MTRDEALAALKKIANEQTTRWEEDHSDADDILLKLIDDEEISAAYAEINKWYA